MKKFILVNAVSGTNSFFRSTTMVIADFPTWAFLLSMSLLVIHFCNVSSVNAGGLTGTIYVPNLHAKCLSTHQSCLLETCVDNPLTIDDQGMPTEVGKACAAQCVADYKVCENKLDRLRALDNTAPLSRSHNYTNQLRELDRLVRQEQGYVD